MKIAPKFHILTKIAILKVCLKETDQLLPPNTVKKWSKKGDRSVKRVKSYSKWSKLLLDVVSFHSISSKILLFLQSDPLFYSIWSNYFLQCIQYTTYARNM